MITGRSGELKRFHGRTVAEAMVRLKTALGQDAIIVSVKKGRRRFLGLFGPRLIEITASADDGLAQVYKPGGHRLRQKLLKTIPSGPPEPEKPPSRTNGKPLVSAVEHAPLPTPPTPPEPPLAVRATTRRLRRELEGIKHLAMDLILQGKESSLNDLPAPWREWYGYLQDIGLSRESAQNVILRFASQPELAESGPDQVGAQVRRLVINRVPMAPPISLPPPGQQHVVALVGSPGSGKTTVLMKLAAQLARDHRGTLGLLSMAAHRVGAAESLESCAQMIGVPFRVVADRSEIGICLSTFADVPLVLVDTPGCSPNNHAGLQRLELLLQGLGQSTVHLVLSASDSASVLRRTITSYASLAPKSVILTRLDETRSPGVMIELADILPGGVSHLSMGQTIPFDLTPASRPTLEQMLFIPSEALGD